MKDKTIEVPRIHQIFVNARAIIERDGKAGREYVVQRRDKPGRPKLLEFPGGTVEANEPLQQALCREVQEETGLNVVEIEGKAVEYRGGDSTVECCEPFAVYQTTVGLNGMGVYFRCRAEGELLQSGDGSSEIRWMQATEMGRIVDEELEQFNGITAAVLLLMRQKGMI